MQYEPLLCGVIIMENILEWFYDGKGQVILGMILFAAGCFCLVAGVIFTLRGLGFFNAT